MIGKAVFHERLWKLRLRKLNCTMDVSKRFLRYSLFLLSWASWFRLVEERNLPQNFCCYVLGVAMDIPIPKIRSLESSFTFPPASVKKKTEIRRPEKKKKKLVFCYIPPSQATPSQAPKGNLPCVDFCPPSVGGWYQGNFLSPPKMPF